MTQSRTNAGESSGAAVVRCGLARPLKAYAVFAKDTRHEHAELVFHRTAKEAKELAWKKPYGEFGCDWIDLCVNRVKESDHLASYANEPFVCSDERIFREAGWRSDDLPECACCGLTDFSDGKNPEWDVCPECDHCGGCGHEAGCVNA